MKKKILIGVMPLVAVLGLWFGLGVASAKSHVAVHAHPAGVHAKLTHVKTTGKASTSSEDPSGTDSDNVQSGDQTTPDAVKAAGQRSSGSADPSGTEGESTTPETDGVDCQQDGNFEGVNTAGTGPGCDGSGT